mgnify:FL=1
MVQIDWNECEYICRCRLDLVVREIRVGVQGVDLAVELRWFEWDCGWAGGMHWYCLGLK